MGIVHWPRGDRPREKLVAQGAAALSNAELISIFLRCGVAGRSAVDVAQVLLTRFGGLRGLLAASAAEFSAVKGVGQAKYAVLQAALEIGRRHLEERLCREGPVTRPRQAGAFLTARLRDRAEEVFCCLYLDTRHFVIGFEELFRGSISGATVHPREVVKRALAVNAAAVIVAHNHPSGIAEPSRADESVTGRLRDALALVDIRLLDHLIVGDSGCVSLSERGLL